MKAKRILCLMLSVLMILSMVTTITFAVETEKAAVVSLSDNMIFVNLSWTPANVPEHITVRGKTYELFWGENAFGNAQKAVDAAPKFGTIYLCPGAFNTNITIQKSLTLLGAKFGIDPNIKGAAEKDLWTLNPERGQDETVLEARIDLGMDKTKVYEEATEIVIDGIMLSDNAQFSSTYDAQGAAKLTFKNLYLKDSWQTSPTFFLCPYNPKGFSNVYQRYVTMENIRVEGHTTGSVMKMTAERADISGVYMAPDCTKPFFESASASSSSTAEVVWSLHDNMFAATVGRTVYFNWDNPASNGGSLSTGVANRSKITSNIYNNVFVNNYRDGGTTTNSTIAFRVKTQNIYFNFIGNAFYHDRMPDAELLTISGYSDVKGDYSDQMVVTGNRFYGNTISAFNFNQSNPYVTVNGNYAEKDGQSIAVPYFYPQYVDTQWYWKDEAMTVKSIEGGEGTHAPAVSEVTTQSIITASQTLPNNTFFVDPKWTEENLPTDITVRNRKFELIWGVNAFANGVAAVDRAQEFGTVYLCAGNYSEGLVVKKSITLLGAKFGIDPNDKENGWELADERGEGESVITSCFNIGADSQNDYADIITIDGVEITEVGQLRSNLSGKGACKITLKNIYIKDSTITGEPLYLYPYWHSTNANTYCRYVTIEGLRVEGQSKAAVLGIVAEHADIGGVYMALDCTRPFFTRAAASNGPTTAAVWNIHDNFFASPLQNIFNLDWHNYTTNKLDLTQGVTKRSKIVNNVYNNTFVENSIAFSVEAEHVNYNFVGNTFTADENVIWHRIDGNSDEQKDYSDQIIVKNNQFIGDIKSAFALENSTAAIDVSGNFSNNQGTVTAIALSEDAGARESWHWLNAEMTKRSDATSELKAPENVTYEIEETGGGKSDGFVTVTLPIDHSADGIYLFWADENGKLSDYSGFAPISITGVQAATRIKSGTYIPAEATHLCAYSYSETLGVSKECAMVKLPDGVAGNDTFGAPTLQFQAVSDIHISTTTAGRKHHDDHLRKMLADVKNINPDSVGIFANGDIVDRAYDEDYAQFLSILSEVEEKPTVYTNFGNHETFRYGTPIPAGNVLADFVNPYMDNLVKGTLPADTDFAYEGSLSYSFKINGYLFIFLGTDVLDKDWIELNNTTLAWLEAKLKTKEPGCPTFVMMHQNTANTGGKSYVRANTEEALKSIFENYPEVIMFNGHSHTSLYDPTSFHIADGSGPAEFNSSAVGYIPATAYNKAEATVGSEGYYVSVYSDRILIRGRDFLNNKWIASAQHVIYLENEMVPSVADRTALNAAIEEAENINVENFSGATVLALQNAVETAKALPPSTNQQTVDAATQAILDAISGLLYKSVESIAVTTLPIKTVYHAGRDALDVTGGKVTVLYDNDTVSVINLTTAMVSGFDNSVEGTLTLRVTTYGKSTTFDVTVAGHTEGALIVDKAANCKNKGTGHTECTVCHKTVKTNVEIPTNNKHDGKWKTVKDATASAVGLKEKRCTRCNKLLDSQEIPKKAAVSFADVKKSDFFYTPVQWAVANGITSGLSENKFGPNSPCTRAQAVTFMWRAAGSPKVTGSNPFTDVKKSDYYYEAVLWAVKNKVTSGTSATKFSPNDVCTRGQIVTFLWRGQGGKKVHASNPFKDVKKSDYYYNAVLWAVKNNVTSGMSSTKFAPGDNCTRGQIVTFLYRATV